MRAILMVMSITALFLAACAQSQEASQKMPKDSCIDSDNGKNLETFGIVKVSDSNGNSYEIKDQCIGNIYLIEGYCEGDEGKTENFVCQKFCDPFDHVCF